MRRFIKKNACIVALIAAGFSTSTLAFDDFAMPFFNASGLGTVYADWASAADDASTAATNPAGLIRLRKPQLVFSGLGLTGNTKFTGSTATPPYPFPGAVIESGSASSRLGAFFPSFYISSPINDRIAVGFSQTIPFGLGTNYSKDSLARYVSTRAKVVVVDLSPSIAVKLTDQLSAGIGFDVNRLAFTLNNMVGPPISVPDSESQNSLYGWGYGWHAGLLYQLLQTTRVGFSFNSMVMFHTSGFGTVYTPFPPFALRNNQQKSNAALPARMQLSAHHDFDSRWSAMATIFYNNWRTFEKLTRTNVLIPGGTLMTVSIPFNYHNTFDYAVGGSYRATDKWLLRAGVQYMNAPSNDQDRALADPIGRATIVGIGARYQQNPCLSYDLALAHSFFKQEAINLVTPLTSASGHTNTQTTVFGGQVNWDIG